MIYIATNKDNRDALMHYGVKGMKWGKRGGSFKWPWEKDDKRKNAYGTGRTVISNTIKTSRRYDPKHARDTNLYTSQLHSQPSPKENNISTSQKTSSAPSKRTKEYFNRQLDRQRADERNWNQKVRGGMNKYSFPKLHADEKKRAAANWDYTHFRQSDPVFHNYFRRERYDPKKRKH